jgi:hypothetical protein
VSLRLGAAVAAVLLLVVFPAIREFRTAAGPERGSLSFFKEAYLSIENPAIATLDELGGTARTVADTVSLVPAVRPFDGGATYGYALLTLAPNAFWDIHPTIARGTASSWLMWTVDPLGAAAGGGIGFSPIAEGYLNAGIIGIALSMLLMGIWLARLDAWAAASPARIATVAALLAFILRWPRDESASMLRPMFWFCFAPYLLVMAIVMFEQKNGLIARTRAKLNDAPKCGLR